MDTTLIDDDKECPEDIKEFIDKYLDAELSTNQDTFFYNSCYLLRKYGDTRNGLGWKAVHYFAKMAGSKIYNKEKVNTWLSGTKIENMKPSYANKIRGKCFITLDEESDGNETDWSQATTADNVIVSKKEKQKIDQRICPCNRSSKVSRLRINFNSPLFTSTSAGRVLELNLLLISKPYAPALLNMRISPGFTSCNSLSHANVSVSHILPTTLYFLRGPLV